MRIVIEVPDYTETFPKLNNSTGEEVINGFEKFQSLKNKIKESLTDDLATIFPDEEVFTWGERSEDEYVFYVQFDSSFDKFMHIHDKFSSSEIKTGVTGTIYKSLCLKFSFELDNEYFVSGKVVLFDPTEEEDLRQIFNDLPKNETHREKYTKEKKKYYQRKKVFFKNVASLQLKNKTT